LVELQLVKLGAFWDTV